MNKQSIKIFIASVVTGLSMVAGMVGAASHQVQPGDTLSHIAQLYQTSVEHLVRRNQINNPNLIHVGQVIEIDGEATTETTEAVAVASTEVASETPDYETYQSSVVLSNGNTPGHVGAYAAAKIAAATGTDALTWEYIIARESNGDPNAYNPSGASGLFQTMPFWGDTSTVEAQIQAAIRAYEAQGFAAWGL